MSKKKKSLDDGPFKRKDRKNLRWSVLTMRVSLLIIVASALIAAMSLHEIIDAIITGQSGISQMDVPEGEYFDFLNQKFPQSILGRVGYYISAVLSLLVHYFRMKWHPVSAYRLGISAVYFIAAVPILIRWVRKRKQVKLDLASKENRYQLEWVDQEILERGSYTAGNLLFIGLALSLTVGQWFLPLASFRMMPILWLTLAFLAWEMIYWIVLRVRFRMGRTEPKVKGKGKVTRSQKSNTTRIRVRKTDRNRAEQIAASVTRRR